MRALTKSLGVMALLLVQLAHGASLDGATQSKIDAKIKEIQSWADSPAIVDAVKKANAGPSAADMTQDKWKALTVLDPTVRAFAKNPAAEFLKSKKGTSVAEAFVSASDGSKVAFLAKPSSWTHLGKPKHDVPMAGKTWQGAVEVDESTGLQQVQVAVPVKDGGKPIGSLVVGLSISGLTQ